MIALLPDSFWLWLNSKMRPLPHPFNESQSGASALNYSPWEFEHFQNQTDFPDLKKQIKGKKTCELACGGGGKSVWMRLNGALQVAGCDLSEPLIAQARAFAQEKNLAQDCLFTLQDAQKTDYQTGEFDLVLLASILEHAPDPEALLREAIRICHPGGRILINFEGYRHWLGHHLWDALFIPWLHLFTSEAQRVRMYKKVVQKYPDAAARLAFRLDEKQEKVAYLNRVSLQRAFRILHHLEKEHLIQIAKLEIKTFRNPLLGLLGRLPLLREIFHERIICELKRL